MHFRRLGSMIVGVGHPLARMPRGRERETTFGSLNVCYSENRFGIIGSTS